jgi:hypothetical protein
VLAETQSLEQLPEAVLRAMLNGLGWDLAALWTVEGSDDVLGCADVVVGPRSDVGRFVQRSRSESFLRGIGLPGRVWEANEPAWIVDVTRDPDLPRAADAAAVGLHTGIGFPIVAAGRIVAVV